MARFKATIKGQNNGHATRLGNDVSGIVAEVMTRRLLLRVHGTIDSTGGEWFRVSTQVPGELPRVVYQIRMEATQPEEGCTGAACAES